MYALSQYPLAETIVENHKKSAETDRFFGRLNKDFSPRSRDNIAI